LSRFDAAVTTRLRIYLAGPDVFLPEAAALAAAKRKLCADYRFVGVAPTDNDTDLSALSKHDAAMRISADNEDLIRSCKLLIANLTPFRGPSADVGTAYEMGFARALGLPVFAYSNVAGSLLERTRGAQVRERVGGGFEDADRMLIEDFDCADNLMLVGAVEAIAFSGEVATGSPPKSAIADLGAIECRSRVNPRSVKTHQTKQGGSHIVISPTPADRRFVDLAGFEACLKLAADQLLTSRRER
jgi:nucleoside 2-deoxyribosyltransferase